MTSPRTEAGLVPYQYVVIRCVPRVDREEFVNVGVVVYCQASDFLAAGSVVDDQRLVAIHPDLDVEGVRTAVERIAAVCRGDEVAGAIAQSPLGTRFGYVTAPRSTVVQPGPVHGGLTAEPGRELAVLVEHYLGTALA